MKEGEAIESTLVTRRIAAAQKKVEERNYEIRKSLLDYDEVMDEQRKRVYRYRQNLLDGHSSRKMILGLVRGQIDQAIGLLTDENLDELQLLKESPVPIPMELLQQPEGSSVRAKLLAEQP